MSGDKWVGLIVPPALVIFGTVLPKLAVYSGKATNGSCLNTSKTPLLRASRNPISESRIGPTMDDC